MKSYNEFVELFKYPNLSVFLNCFETLRTIDPLFLSHSFFVLEAEVEQPKSKVIKIGQPTVPPKVCAFFLFTKN